MNVKKIETGYLKENCYVLSKGNECLIVDPGDDFINIKRLIGNKIPLAILITHYHFDHVGALDECLKEYNVNVIDYKSKKIQNIGPFNFEIIDTKGHKEDAVTYYFSNEKIMFTGDFIFEGTIGRCDLPGGNFDEMKKSIEKIKKYHKDIILYPGHGKKTSLKDELINNIYMKGDFDE